MRHHVAQAGEVHLVGLQQVAQGALGCEHDLEQMALVSGQQVAHFGNVLVPDHAAESRVGFVIDLDHATAPVLPDHLLVGCNAQRTIHVQFSTAENAR